ncbi:hypothetical protein J6590_016485 [Homalodisca vitripennis]|nr:hypothetical protein J6590_016485 [Homalodisca vitripennis]
MRDGRKFIAPVLQNDNLQVDPRDSRARCQVCDASLSLSGPGSGRLCGTGPDDPTTRRGRGGDAERRHSCTCPGPANQSGVLASSLLTIHPPRCSASDFSMEKRPSSLICSYVIFVGVGTHIVYGGSYPHESGSSSAVGTAVVRLHAFDTVMINICRIQSRERRTRSRHQRLTACRSGNLSADTCLPPLGQHPEQLSGELIQECRLE